MVLGHVSACGDGFNYQHACLLIYIVLNLTINIVNLEKLSSIKMLEIKFC